MTTAGSIDPGVNPNWTHSHCTQEADVSGFKRVFLASVKEVIDPLFKDVSQRRQRPNFCCLQHCQTLNQTQGQIAIG